MTKDGNGEYLALGQTVGERYRIVGVRGRTISGQAYKALDGAGRPFILKTIGLSGNDDRQRRLLDREARYLRALHHPNVVRYVDTFLDRGHLFLVQEYIDGVDLGAWQRGRALAELLAVYAQIADALGAIHEAGYVHRDLKPGSVMVSDHPHTAHIADFGLAMRVNEGDAEIGGAALVGTPLYVPPEAVADGKAQPRSDVYSLAVMLYEALVDGGLWDPQVDVSVLLLARLEELPPEVLEPLRPLEKLGLVALIQAMLANDARQRPEAHDVARRLREAERLSAHDPELATLAQPAFAPATSMTLMTRSIDAPKKPRGSSWALLFGSLVLSVVALVLWLLPQLGVGGPAERLHAWWGLLRDAPAWDFLRHSSWWGALRDTQVMAALRHAVDSDKSWVRAALLLPVGLGLMALLYRSRKRAAGRATPPGAQARVEAAEAELRSRNDGADGKRGATSPAGGATSAAGGATSHKLGPAHLEKLVRESVMVAMDQMRGGARGAPPHHDVMQAIATALGAGPVPKNEKRSLRERMGAFLSTFGAIVTTIAGAVALLSSLDLFHPNHSPEIVSMGAESMRARRDTPLSLSVEARDPDGDPLTYSFHASLGSVTASGNSVRWTLGPGPHPEAPRAFTLTATVSDGKRTVTKERTIAINTPPAGRLAAPAEAAPATTVELKAEITDGDGDVLTYEWHVSAGSLLSTSGPTVFWQAPRDPVRAEIICQVGDGVESAVLTAPVTVKADAPTPPIAPPAVAPPPPIAPTAVAPPPPAPIKRALTPMRRPIHPKRRAFAPR